MILSEHPFIKNFGPELGGTLCRYATIIDLETDDLVFDEGDAADALYLVLDGRVVLEKKYQGADCFVLKEAGPGGHFGELAVLDGTARGARARAAMDSNLARIEAGKLLAILEKAPAGVVYRFFLPVAGELRASNHRFVRAMLQKEKLAVIGEMADTIMHDFRSPLTTLQLACDLLRREVANTRSERFCDTADRQIRLLQVMMEELLEFSRGTPKLKKAPVPVADLFDSIRSHNELLMNRSRVDLVIEPAGVVLEIDVDKVLRVMQNLLNNAVDAMGESGSIVVGARSRNGGWTELFVRDDGPGIPEAIRETLFEPFVTHGKKKGTGIGLAIVKNLVEAHGGNVSFTSEAGKGTEFRMLLPTSTRGGARRATG